MRSKLLPILWMVFCVSQALAAHTRLPDVGNTNSNTKNSIIEADLLEELRQKAPRLDLEVFRNSHDRYQPANLHKLPRATADRVFTVDLTYTLDHDIKDAQGFLYYPQGFTFNPLQYVCLSGGLVVIDGSDPQQVEWFKGSPYFQNHRAILLLSGGYAPELGANLKKSVYYLTRDMADRLKLKKVPSVVIEQARKLTVREVFFEN